MIQLSDNSLANLNESPEMTGSLVRKELEDIKYRLLALFHKVPAHSKLASEITELIEKIDNIVKMEGEK